MHQHITWDRDAQVYVVDLTAVDEDPPSIAIVKAVAALTEADIFDLEPFHGSVNPDALDDLFDPTDGSPTPSGRLEFSYEGFDITIQADGTLLLRPVDASRLVVTPYGFEG